MTAFSVIALLATQASGAAGGRTPSADSRAQGSLATARVSAPDTTLGANRSARPQVSTVAGSSPASAGLVQSHRVGNPGESDQLQRGNCSRLRKAVRFYSRRVAYWRDKMGAGVVVKHVTRNSGVRQPCPRYLSHVLQHKAYGLRKAFEDWHFYHYRWDHWLPAKWYRIARCETGVNWRHSNSSYEGAFGFAKQSWDSFKYRADRKAGPYPQDAWQATPRQQYEVALAIYRAFGLSGWGCRNA